MYNLTYAESMKIIGGLSKPSKMPWFGWSISAYECKTGSKLRKVEGSTCSKCYACKGNYVFRNVRVAHNRRLDALSDPRFVEAFVVVLQNLYKNTRTTYVKDGQEIKENRFRWHDAGDLQDTQHLEKIVSIAEQTPYVDHWLPTREFKIVNDYLKSGKIFPTNLTVRMSAVMIGEGFKDRPMGLPYSTVGFDNPLVSRCPAYTQDGMCGDCRTCWDKDKDVNYPLH